MKSDLFLKKVYANPLISRRNTLVSTVTYLEQIHLGPV